MHTLWIFPGQGGQHAGMLRNVDPQLLTEVTQLTGITLADTQVAYQDSVQIQLGILVLQLAQIKQLQQLGWQPDVVAGHSLGIFAAAVAAGTLDQSDAIQLVAKRAALMQNAYPTGYGMGAIVGLTRSEVTDLTAQVTTDQAPVYVSNQNAELQTAVSGSLSGIQKVIALAKDHGAQKALTLHVPVPSHSPLMTDVANQLTELVTPLALQQPNCAYLANWNGHRLRTADEISFDLANNLRFPVYWDTMMAVSQELGTNVAMELAPGHAFTKLIKAKFADLRTISLADMQLADADYLLNKWKEVL